MVRVTRRHGTVGAAVWDYSGEMTLLRRFWDPAASDRDEGNCMPFCTPNELSDLRSEADLAAVHVAAVVVGADYDGFDDLWRPLGSGVGPSGAYAAALTPERRA